jgi:hypothetical protein
MTNYMGHQSDRLDFFCSVRIGARINNTTLSIVGFKTFVYISPACARPSM